MLVLISLLQKQLSLPLLSLVVELYGNNNYTINSCNTGMSDLSDVYIQSQRAADPRAEGGHTRQTTSDCVTATYYVTLS